eukprot:4238632-Prymnesium_polylepis.1
MQHALVAHPMSDVATLLLPCTLDNNRGAKSCQKRRLKRSLARPSSACGLAVARSAWRMPCERSGQRAPAPRQPRGARAT